MKRTLLFVTVFAVFVVIVNANAQNQINHYNDQGLSSESLIEQDVKIYSNMRDREIIRMGIDGRSKLRYFYLMGYLKNIFYKDSLFPLILF